MKIPLCSLLLASGVVTGWSVEKEVTGFADQPVQIPISWEEGDDESLSICLYTKSQNESAIACVDKISSDKIELPEDFL